LQKKDGVFITSVIFLGFKNIDNESCIKHGPVYLLENRLIEETSSLHLLWPLWGLS